MEKLDIKDSSESDQNEFDETAHCMSAEEEDAFYLAAMREGAKSDTLNEEEKREFIASLGLN